MRRTLTAVLLALSLPLLLGGCGDSDRDDRIAFARWQAAMCAVQKKIDRLPVGRSAVDSGMSVYRIILATLESTPLPEGRGRDVQALTDELRLTRRRVAAAAGEVRAAERELRADLSSDLRDLDAEAPAPYASAASGRWTRALGRLAAGDRTLALTKRLGLDRCSERGWFSYSVIVGVTVPSVGEVQQSR